MNDAEKSNYRKALLILLTITTLFRLFYVQWLELAPDEAITTIPPWWGS